MFDKCVDQKPTTFPNDVLQMILLMIVHDRVYVDMNVSNGKQKTPSSNRVAPKPVVSYHGADYKGLALSKSCHARGRSVIVSKKAYGFLTFSVAPWIKTKSAVEQYR